MDHIHALTNTDTLERPFLAEPQHPGAVGAMASPKRLVQVELLPPDLDMQRRHGHRGETEVGHDRTGLRADACD